MDLLDQLRGMRDQHASTPSEGDDHDCDRYGALIDQAVNLIMETSDEDLLGAFRRTTQDLSDPEADALMAEIERRGLTV